MSMGPLSSTAHPRLLALVSIGAVLVVLGALGILADPSVAPDSGTLGLRVGFLGFLLFVFGVAGYVAIGVFDHRPNP